MRRSPRKANRRTIVKSEKLFTQMLDLQESARADISRRLRIGKYIRWSTRSVLLAVVLIVVGYFAAWWFGFPAFALGSAPESYFPSSAKVFVEFDPNASSSTPRDIAKLAAASDALTPAMRAYARELNDATHCTGNVRCLFSESTWGLWKAGVGVLANNDGVLEPVGFITTRVPWWVLGMHASSTPTQQDNGLWAVRRGHTIFFAEKKTTLQQFGNKDKTTAITTTLEQQDTQGMFIRGYVDTSVFAAAPAALASWSPVASMIGLLPAEHIGFTLGGADATLTITTAPTSASTARSAVFSQPDTLFGKDAAMSWTGDNLADLITDAEKSSLATAAARGLVVESTKRFNKDGHTLAKDILPYAALPYQVVVHADGAVVVRVATPAATEKTVVVNNLKGLVSAPDKTTVSEEHLGNMVVYTLTAEQILVGNAKTISWTVWPSGEMWFATNANVLQELVRTTLTASAKTTTSTTGFFALRFVPLFEKLGWNDFALFAKPFGQALLLQPGTEKTTGTFIR